IGVDSREVTKPGVRFESSSLPWSAVPEAAMPELAFRVAGASVAEGSVIPAVAIQLEIVNGAAPETIQSILLRSQVHIEAPRRRYSKTEERGLKDLFGEPAQWSRSLKPLLWVNATNVVGSFDRSIVIDVTLPCTTEFHASVSGYFDALEDGV